MKFAFMSFSTPELDLAETLEVARRYGYEGIEPRLDSAHGHGIEVSCSPGARAEIRNRMRDSGIGFAALATSLNYSDPDQRNLRIQETLERIDLAGDIGAPGLRIFGGLIPGELTRDRARSAIIEALGQVADHAAARGVFLAMETHDDWCAPEEVARIMSACNHAAVGVTWDIMHPVRQGGATMHGAFETLKPWIRHVHVHDGKAERIEFLPIGTGVIDHATALRDLRAAGYAGYLSGEWIEWQPFEKHLPRELAALRRL